MMKQIGYVIFSLSLSAASSQARDCNISEFRDFIDYKSDISSYLHYLNTISLEEFSNTSRGNKIGITIPIDGIPLSANADEDNFNQAKNSFFSSIDFDQSVDASIAYVMDHLTPAGLAAYQACLSDHREGVVASLLSATDSEVTVQFSYKRGGGDPNKIKLKLDFSGASEFEDVVEIEDSNPKTITYRRLSGQPFRVDINSNDATVISGQLRLAAPYKLPRNIALVHVRAWADGSSFDEARNRYVDKIVPIKIDPTESRLVIFEASSILWITSVFPNKEYMAWIIDRNNPPVFGNRTTIGASSAMINRDGSDYHVWMRGLSEAS